MSIRNALASVAVKDLDAAQRWYERVLGAKASRPMDEVAEWHFAGGGALQVYRLPERAGRCSCTLAVDDLEREADRLSGLGIDTHQRIGNEKVRTVMIADLDGNSLAFAQTLDPALVH